MLREVEAEVLTDSLIDKRDYALPRAIEVRTIMHGDISFKRSASIITAVEPPGTNFLTDKYFHQFSSLLEKLKRIHPYLKSRLDTRGGSMQSPSLVLVSGQVNEKAIYDFPFVCVQGLPSSRR